MAFTDKHATVARDTAVSTPLYESRDPLHRSKWNPRAWSRWTIIGVVVAVVVIVVAIIVGAVVGSRASKTYPDYSPLNYTLQDTYSGPSFFDNFDYLTGSDPAGGFVQYESYEVANSAQYNLTYASSTSAILRVDTTNQNATAGRSSVRITSKKQYNSGLFIFDILRTPYGCSLWPALWLTDPNNWPYNGEIDVVEAVNQAASGNQMTLHTSSGCSMSSVRRKETGHVLTGNCLNSTDNNAGCGVRGPDASSGAAFNAAGGGVYALEWRSAGIRIWFFPRASVPSDIVVNADNATVAPDPSTWGTPLADFPSTHCDVGAHFRNQSIVANIDMCGPWAAAADVYGVGNDACPGTCTEFAATNATAFETAVWEWAGWRVYVAS